MTARISYLRSICRGEFSEARKLCERVIALDWIAGVRRCRSRFFSRLFPTNSAPIATSSAPTSRGTRQTIATITKELDVNEAQIRAALDTLGEKDIPPERLAARLASPWPTVARSFFSCGRSAVAPDLLLKDALAPRRPQVLEFGAEVLGDLCRGVGRGKLLGFGGQILGFGADQLFSLRTSRLTRRNLRTFRFFGIGTSFTPNNRRGIGFQPCRVHIHPTLRKMPFPILLRRNPTCSHVQQFNLDLSLGHCAHGKGRSGPWQ